MGQTSGRQERNKKPEVAPSEIMEAEIEVQNTKEETKDVKAKNQKLTSVFGLADLKNEAIGLYNLGQSCCLNSLLQVFLMNIHFTRILRRITVPPSPAQRRNNVPYQMLLLLEKMQCGKCKAVGPTDLACCLSEHRVELFVQHDAAQLFLTLWNLLKKQMKKPELVEELSDLYTICIQEHLACQKCSFEVKNNSTMLTLPLPVLDANSHRLKTLEDCLQYFFHPEELTGQNMCFCQQCGRKTTFLQSMKLVHLPQTLALHLKRFCFERSSRTQKLSLHLPFPQELDLREILTESQCQADDSEKGTWQFELFAVVAHSGLSSCGHYCAYIRSLTDCKWYCFNDSEVCQVSWDDVKCTYGHSNLYWRETAYLLFYMKKHPQQPWPGVSECL
uniref:Ubiquitin carboxyl-terminal hydrolase n=1 Tax=Taeniopygia guttata TaxID=59729 RepID=H0ZQH2_TAEGU|nr:ubl carboxyl-terminal hydrolase 18 [Taeniopygia guttata]XP_030119469.3 ubl carboxyl-terminal hydrolase 18 [Taeniopygia guttata]XP_030119470.3 ubl carboxyl-terminal hydrolase 18 [Taeniopygia guttata]XP_030119471.3 ubl carboxyl-terminal hydrolase 18 [Taeniopygia guttata]XP_032602281.2 ubl carboxyl-terminal hydrolase 18 [Taeniopygia guttata]XP_041569641.1 ubl carboxyl-terminal hydrolase 18 [Taeniopygia guttata]